MIRLCLIAAAFLFAFAPVLLPDCPFVPTVLAQTDTPEKNDPDRGKKPPEKSATLYVTKTGKRYHRSACRFLSVSKSPITLEDAKRRGYTPCKTCKP